ncbi:Uncharacterised protein [Halioglobus japonicus]|nr:Uncharacterised protein [Halioglobus japonicus]
MFSEREMVEALRELLAAERAGARAATACLALAQSSDEREQLQQLHQREVDSCRALLACLIHLGVTPGNDVGEFYNKVIALDTLDERLLLIDKGQRWVLRRVELLLANTDDESIRAELELVRCHHQAE